MIYHDIKTIKNSANKIPIRNTMDRLILRDDDDVLTSVVIPAGSRSVPPVGCLRCALNPGSYTEIELGDDVIRRIADTGEAAGDPLIISEDVGDEIGAVGAVGGYVSNCKVVGFLSASHVERATTQTAFNLSSTSVGVSITFISTSCTFGTFTCAFNPSQHLTSALKSVRHKQASALKPFNSVVVNAVSVTLIVEVLLHILR